MKELKKAAREAKKKSNMCKQCPMWGSCLFQLRGVCYRSFREGFENGAKWAEKQLKEKL